jgi:hypothetical protein
MASKIRPIVAIAINAVATKPHGPGETTFSSTIVGIGLGVTARTMAVVRNALIALLDKLDSQPMATESDDEP